MNYINDYKILNDGIILISNFEDKGDILFTKIKNHTDWDNSIKSRKTASFGMPYNYSNLKYDFLDFPDYILKIIDRLEKIIDYRPNNCLINYYYDNLSKMGYHSDQIDILDSNTGIIIISLGGKRIMRFKNKINLELFEIVLEPNSLLYMTQEIQEKWMHSILSEQENEGERISITLRKIKSEL
ncbi:alpha-ketoglutarate-dependent dioxygenase AlkB [Epilithonimonas sp. JDS]|uniref:alpha-ketoglutarate-dependent dioxygenase AlkB n=1 Tax=Epilithonimonas sp. JDS TaxID=2902797 RepID=UPI001E4520A2|nr:alpha-ketoglutarate-dependent dioxygenase AlkB [Epilithonimonas sp. JDS]MCD9855570.1 alpha-ketoglutarate-dependent dioxygenase AlkB [Epilithonimonas sp. JDS]